MEGGDERQLAFAGSEVACIEELLSGFADFVAQNELVDFFSEQVVWELGFGALAAVFVGLFHELFPGAEGEEVQSVL